MVTRVVLSIVAEDLEDRHEHQAYSDHIQLKPDILDEPLLAHFYLIKCRCVRCLSKVQESRSQCIRAKHFEVCNLEDLHHEHVEVGW